MPGPTVFTSSYGRAAAMLLRERLSVAKADDPLHPVSVVVPTNYVGVSTRRQLASGALGSVTARAGGIAGLTLLTIYRLAELLGAPALAADGRRPVSTPLLGAVVRQVLRAQPGVFAPVVDHPSTEQALVRAYRELSELTPDAVETLSAAPVERVREVVRIHRAVHARLAPGWYDEADLMTAAAAEVQRGPPVLDDLGTVVVYLPEDLSPPAAGLLRTLAEVAPVEVIAGMTGVADADADVVRSLRRLGLTAPERVDTIPPDIHEIVSVSDADEEVRSAVARVLAAAHESVPLSRIAVLYPQPEPYARILDEQLTAAGIAFNGAAVRPLADRLVGRWLLDLLDLPDRDFARPAVMELLTSAPVVGRDGWWLPSGTWERISREAGVVRGRADWDRRLTRYADLLDGRAARREAAAADQDAGVARYDRRRAEHTRRLAGAVDELGAALTRALTLDTWSVLAAWCRSMVDRWIDRRRDAWPDIERDAADRVAAALDRLAGLDDAEPATDLATFRRALAAELDADLGRIGELGRGVFVGPVSAALGVDLDVVVVLGMAESLMPTRPREDSLLPDSARRMVAQQLTPRDERAGVEHRHLLAALAGAGQRRVLVFPRGDLRRSVEHAPSRWLLDAVERRSGVRSLPSAAPWLTTVPSFAGRVRSTPRPATHRQYTLRVLADASRDGPRAVGVLPGVSGGDPRLARAAEVVRQRAAGEFGRHTGRLTGRAAALVAERTRDEVTSATTLEQWLDCPHAYLLRHVLRVSPIENPEELLRISPLERGLLVHDVLERWLRERIDAGVPSPRAPWPAEAVAALRTLAAAALDDAEARGVTGHPLLWSLDRARMAADFEAFVDLDAARRGAHGLTPTATELAFGFGSGLPELCIDLGDGRRVRLRGYIDRVDVAADGSVHVADYKTGKPRHYDPVRADPLAGGLKLQLPVYGLAVREAHRDAPTVFTEYWFVTRGGEGQRIRHEVTAEVEASLTRTLRSVADGIRGGLFPMRPPDKPSYGFVQCAYCDPDGLGTAEQYREWERIRTDPALRDYVGTVEPDTPLAAGTAAQPGSDGLAAAPGSAEAQARAAAEPGSAEARE